MTRRFDFNVRYYRKTETLTLCVEVETSSSLHDELAEEITSHIDAQYLSQVLADALEYSDCSDRTETGHQLISFEEKT